MTRTVSKIEPDLKKLRDFLEQKSSKHESKTPNEQHQFLQNYLQNTLNF